MIARMSKVGIIGPREGLEKTVSLLRDSGVFEIDPEIIESQEDKSPPLVPVYLEDSFETERAELLSFKSRIHELFGLMPDVEVRKGYLKPEAAARRLRGMVEGHISRMAGIVKERESLGRTLIELNRYIPFLKTMQSIMEGREKGPGIEFIGVSVNFPENLKHLKTVLLKLTGGEFELIVRPAPDGTMVVMIVTRASFSERIRRALSDEKIPELGFPGGFEDLPFSERISMLEDRITELTARVSRINEDLRCFALSWKPMYGAALGFINERLSLINASGMAYESKMFFYITAWAPTKELAGLNASLETVFKGAVVLQELSIREDEMDRVPIRLDNSPFFRHFELFTRLLPLPRYGSYDPTPFLGLFFPLFFGIMLADWGYGLIILCVSIFLRKRFKARSRLVFDGASVFAAGSLWAIAFGVLFGEFFGDLGQRLFGLEAVLFERQEAIVPMMAIAVGMGVGHLELGFILGMLSALRAHRKREAAFRGLMAVSLIVAALLVSSVFGIVPKGFSGPLAFSALALAVMLPVAGGLLAPLELIKSIGNVISYVRIMAIGLTSVLLAVSANKIAGMAGGIVLGILAGGFLHALNLALGVFSPAIQSLRLHYVEFFGKFMEHGGRKFKPLGKV